MSGTMRLKQLGKFSSGEGTFNSNYAVTDIEGAARFATAVMEGMEDDQEENDTTSHENISRKQPKKKVKQTVKDKTGSSGVITDSDRKVLKDNLWKNGKPPKSAGKDAITKAIKNKEFNKVYNKIMKAKDGDEREARKTIYKSVVSGYMKKMRKEA